MDYASTINNKILRTIYIVIVKIQRFFAMLVGIAVPIIVVYQVILRYFLKMPLMGIEELLVFPIIWLYMLGGSIASEQRNHIECGIMTLYMKKDTTIASFKVFKSIMSTAIVLWLLRWSYWYFAYSFKMWKTSDILHIPMFFAEGIIFIGFLLMTLFTVIELFDNVRNAIKVFKNKGGKA